MRTLTGYAQTSTLPYQTLYCVRVVYERPVCAQNTTHANEPTDAGHVTPHSSYHWSGCVLIFHLKIVNIVVNFSSFLLCKRVAFHINHTLTVSRAFGSARQIWRCTRELWGSAGWAHRPHLDSTHPDTSSTQTSTSYGKTERYKNIQTKDKNKWHTHKSSLI